MSFSVKLIRYIVVGVIGTAIHFGVLIALVERLGVEPVTASTIGFIITLVVSYMLNHRWTFRTDRGHLSAMPRYILVSVSGLLLNSGIMFVTVHILGLWYILGQSLVVVVVPLTNFLFNYHWSFRPVTYPAADRPDDSNAV